jgi:Domain of unknown function (DUF6429)
VDIDTDKIDEAVLALLFLTLHDGVRAWKGHDWDVLDRLYRKGMIDNPVGGGPHLPGKREILPRAPLGSFAPTLKRRLAMKISA